MTRRIVAGFLGVLTVLLALVVIPLGVKLSAQERSDFHHSVSTEARSLAAAAEETLGDSGDAGDRAPTRLSGSPGDTLLLFDRVGRLVRMAGPTVPEAFVADAAAGEQPTMSEHVVAVSLVGQPKSPDGRVVLVRPAESLDHRLHELWVVLALAAVAALVLGVLTAILIARWIGKPLHHLTAAAGRMGEGELDSRAPATTGPVEVRDLATTFNEMAERLGALVDSQRMMTADVSHQLRTPLSALRLRLELLAEDADASTQAELADALREIARLNRLVDGLLAVARAEAAMPMPESTELSRLVDERVALWRPVAEEKHVRISSSTVPSAVATTPGHVEQILDNLIANALDILETGDEVDVSTTSEDGQVVLTVRDNGPGMASPLRARAFDRFEGDRSGRKSGLGLAIVARLVAADHGHITLSESDGGGLCATVSWPVH